MLTQEVLKTLVHYNELTGEFTNLSKRCSRLPVGSVIGYKSKDGYIRVGVAGKYYPAHRLATFYMTGEWPKEIVDHINNIKHDNRWINLREATHSENNRNKLVTVRSVTGAKGVSRRKDGKFVAYVCLGTFDTVEEAKFEYDRVAKELYGEFFKA